MDRPLRYRPTRGEEAQPWVDLMPSPAINEGFNEVTQVAFYSPGEQGILRIDDEPIQRHPADSSVFLWTPGFYSGLVLAEFEDAGFTQRYLLDVSPDPSKTGRAVFAAMLQELIDEDPSLAIGSEPATSRLGALGTSANPFVEFARLRRFLPDFLLAARSIQANPRYELRKRRATLPLHRVRRVDRQTALAAVRNVASLSWIGGGPPRAAGAHLDVPISEETLDSAANRCLLALVRSLVTRTRLLQAKLAAMVQREEASETRTALGPRWPARRAFLDSAERDLLRLARQRPFSDVSRAEVTAAGLNAVAADPVYARAWGRGWRALRSGIGGAPAPEDLWLSPTWEVYEGWCFARIGRELRTRNPDLTWQKTDSHPSRAIAAWVGTSTHTIVELLLQPEAPAERRRAAYPLHSVSGRRVPDLILTEMRGEELRFWVFDAKYRTSRAAVLDAMTSAHVYQDALRMNGRRSESSTLLVPNGGGAPWLEDPEFVKTNRVGVRAYAPEREEAPLPVDLAGR